MTSFLQRYKVTDSGLDIARFHFDTEYSVTEAGNANFVFLLYAMSLDPRWTTDAVPGFGTMTMQQIWDQARATWSGGGTQNYYLWDDFPNVTDAFGTGALHPERPLDAACGFFDLNHNNGDPIHNRDLFLWYESVATRARNAAIKTAAYDTVKTS